MRERQKRNMMATLLLSQGTPMLLAGDEFGRTQGGNNNAYCQDNEISWVDWNIDADGKKLSTFVRRLIALRHTYPILRRGRFFTGEFNEALGIKDVRWVNATGDEMKPEDWESTDHALLRHADGRPRAGDRHPARGKRRDLAAGAQRASWRGQFHPAGQPGRPPLVAVFDTNVPCEVLAAAKEVFGIGDTYAVTGRSTVLFALQT